MTFLAILFGKSFVQNIHDKFIKIVNSKLEVQKHLEMFESSKIKQFLILVFIRVIAKDLDKRPSSEELVDLLNMIVSDNFDLDKFEILDDDLDKLNIDMKEAEVYLNHKLTIRAFPPNLEKKNLE